MLPTFRNRDIKFHYGGCGLQKYLIYNLFLFFFERYNCEEKLGVQEEKPKLLTEKPKSKRVLAQNIWTQLSNPYRVQYAICLNQITIFEFNFWSFSLIKSNYVLPVAIHFQFSTLWL